MSFACRNFKLKIPLHCNDGSTLPLFCNLQKAKHRDTTDKTACKLHIAYCTKDNSNTSNDKEHFRNFYRNELTLKLQ